jgi:RNA polymerase sigma-70 factor (ECF subfamily)
MNTMGPELLGRLMDRHGPALELLARGWCRSPADVVQEAFIELARRSPAPDNPVGWLYRVVRNGAIGAGRKEERRRRHEAAAGQRREPSFDAEVTAALDGESVAASLAALPLEQRETIVARLWGGLSFEEIAELTESSSSTAHRRYQAGLAQLRKQLGVPCRKNESTHES